MKESDGAAGIKPAIASASPADNSPPVMGGTVKSGCQDSGHDESATPAQGAKLTMELKAEKPKNEQEHPAQQSWHDYVTGKVAADTASKILPYKTVVSMVEWTPVEYKAAA